MERACIAAVALAAGVFLGLGVAWVNGPAYPELEKDRKELRTAVAGQNRTIAELKAAVAAAEDRRRLLLIETAAAKKERDEAKGNVAQVLADWMKVNAILQLIVEGGDDLEGGTLAILRNYEFKQKFKAEWYAPRMSFGVIGIDWFFRELEDYGLLPAEVRADMKASAKLQEMRAAEINREPTKPIEWEHGG